MSTEPNKNKKMIDKKMRDDIYELIAAYLADTEIDGEHLQVFLLRNGILLHNKETKTNIIISAVIKNDDFDHTAFLKKEHQEKKTAAVKAEKAEANKQAIAEKQQELNDRFAEQRELAAQRAYETALQNYKPKGTQKPAIETEKEETELAGTQTATVEEFNITDLPEFPNFRAPNSSRQDFEVEENISATNEDLNADLLSKNVVPSDPLAPPWD